MHNVEIAFKIADSPASLILNEKISIAVSGYGKINTVSTSCTKSHITTTKQIKQQKHENITLKLSYIVPESLKMMLLVVTAGEIQSPHHALSHKYQPKSKKKKRKINFKTNLH